MRTMVNLMPAKLCFFALAVGALLSPVLAQDAELANYKSGIDVIWDGTKGVDYYEEYFYHDKLISDAKVVYIKSTTPISMSHNERNTAIYASTAGGRKIIGINGLDGAPNTGDEGVIRYKIDRDRQWRYTWSQNSTGTAPYVLPAYTTPFTLASQTYADSGASVVGGTGWVGNPSDKSAYHRGIIDSFGDEWHVLAYADDDRAFVTTATPASFEVSSDGKTVLLVVNPKTPCFTARATGNGQFYTTPPKAYFTPKIVPQTTYISGTVSIELRDINGNNVFYRINGGSYTNAGASTVTINETSFNDGTNTLEYYYQGNEAFVKTRTVVKNPTHPSLAEPHGFYLFGDNNGLNAAKSRITRAPYLSTYTAYRTRGDFSGQDSWDQWAGKGYRINPLPTAFLQGNSYALINAFVALVEGSSYKRAEAPKTYAIYAKEMLIENARTINPLGFELSHSSDAIPSRELHYRGYYDALPILHTAFAYDIVAANFRSDQIAGGLTPIEDYFVRDTLAGFAYEAMQHSANMNIMGSSIWQSARMMAGVSIAMIMPEYSSPYYGTSGFGSVQTTYPLCPYQNDEYTWKEALFDGQTRGTYPNFTYNIGLSDNGSAGNASLFMAEGETYAGNAYPLGTWVIKADYFSQGLMGIHLQIWANMAKMWGGGKTDPRLEIAAEAATKGTFIGANDPYPQTGRRLSMLFMLNSRWPNLVANNLSWVQSLPSADNNSDDKSMNVFGFAFYDDQGGSSPPPPTTIAPSNAKVSITVSGP